MLREESGSNDYGLHVVECGAYSHPILQVPKTTAYKRWNCQVTRPANCCHLIPSNRFLDGFPVPSQFAAAVVVVYPLPWPLLVGGVRCSRLWSTSQLLRPSGQQCSHSGGVCPQIQGRQCGAYVGAVEEMMCVVCVDVTEGA